ncbi:hypothetical protein FPQ18DRAFT_310015 [Pyronema domesticum]|uniref:Uncharacterized protein n=1 Tax=Pyronema omphalodes (strain CBS 100304) TaxID=1076935 RepID=U4LDJ7_PYROM|nr:hypothetical protein FPQ18DRAFT_310015 [Pyronema domesticum]CCX30184.1 Protein of unknown function [Pyronema omphalodes CBS 100304]
MEPLPLLHEPEYEPPESEWSESEAESQIWNYDIFTDGNTFSFQWNHGAKTLYKCLKMTDITKEPFGVSYVQFYTFDVSSLRNTKNIGSRNDIQLQVISEGGTRNTLIKQKQWVAWNLYSPGRKSIALVSVACIDSNVDMHSADLRRKLWNKYLDEYRIELLLRHAQENQRYMIIKSRVLSSKSLAPVHQYLPPDFVQILRSSTKKIYINIFWPDPSRIFLGSWRNCDTIEILPEEQNLNDETLCFASRPFRIPFSDTEIFRQAQETPKKVHVFLFIPGQPWMFRIGFSQYKITENKLWDQHHNIELVLHLAFDKVNQVRKIPLSDVQPLVDIMVPEEVIMSGSGLASRESLSNDLVQSSSFWSTDAI